MPVTCVSRLWLTTIGKWNPENGAAIFFFYKCVGFRLANNMTCICKADVLGQEVLSTYSLLDRSDLICL